MRRGTVKVPLIRMDFQINENIVLLMILMNIRALPLNYYNATIATMLYL